jgi:acetyltransferase-like isoleucine patch superfamily enzyme
MRTERRGEKPTIGIQETLGRGDRTALEKYQDLVVGSRGIARLLLHEIIVTTTSWIPGALGLVLRRIAYPLLLGAVGRGVVFGHGVVLRHPAKIRLGDGVVVDDNVVLDAKGETNKGIVIGNNAFLGRGTILSCKNGDIHLGDNVNIGFHSEIFSGSSVTVGSHGLFAAYTYLVGGGHEFDRPDLPILEQQRSSRGIALGDNVWLGAGAKVLDGARIGSNVVIGANAVVNGEIPDDVVAVGVPARVLRSRKKSSKKA